MERVCRHIDSMHSMFIDRAMAERWSDKWEHLHGMGGPASALMRHTNASAAHTVASV